jgi:hypothetical protein
MCGEVVARAAPYGPGTVTIQGILDFKSDSFGSAQEHFET